MDYPRRLFGAVQALPNLKHLTIQGSTGLVLGDIEHAGLESLEIICGGLPMDVLKSIAQAKLPNLLQAGLYLGVDNYGFDGSVEEIEAALAEMDFPKLEYLGLLDSELQDELVPVALACPLAKQLTTLDLSCGTLTDKGGALLLAGVAALPKLQKLDLHHHFLSDEMMAKLGALPITVDVSEQNTPDEYGGELYYYCPDHRMNQLVLLGEAESKRTIYFAKACRKLGISLKQQTLDAFDGTPEPCLIKIDPPGSTNWTSANRRKNWRPIMKN